MNVLAIASQRMPVKLTVADFMLLKRAGAFSDFAKAELLEGELSGVPRHAATSSNQTRPSRSSCAPSIMRCLMTQAHFPVTTGRSSSMVRSTK
ncbi:hypothetical protein [uncultured Sphingomonas sp.]|uniref:hypothetical protein n=1 Tax=uncultured Sphingomonas sp. TaxID=158754 RepID=UPI0035CA6E19